MLDIINTEYYYSGRKAILDYVLRDEDERNRIGISKVLKPVEQWGCSSRKTICLSAESIRMTAEARLQISENLLLLPKCTLKIMKEWEKY